MINLSNRRIIVNNDFDGCLSAKLLMKFYSCKVVGFSNSKDCLWFIDDEHFMGDELFVDMFTPFYDSVDQHIPPYKFEHSFSPNNERGYYAFDRYTEKFPFSTFIWLLAVAARDGFDVQTVLPSNLCLGEEYRVADIIFRADDSLMNFSKYKKNCLDWAKYLLDYSNNNAHLKNLFDFMNLQNYINIEKWKNRIDEYFSTKYGFKKEEIPDIDTEKARIFMEKFGIKFEKVTEVLKMKHIRATISNIEEFQTFFDREKENLFSFAFVYSPWNKEKKNFSYTLKNE